MSGSHRLGPCPFPDLSASLFLRLLLYKNSSCLVLTVVLSFSCRVSLFFFLFVIFATLWTSRGRISVSVSECEEAQDAANDRAVPYRPPPTARDRNLPLARRMERREDWGWRLLMDRVRCYCITCSGANSLCGPSAFTGTPSCESPWLVH